MLIEFFGENFGCFRDEFRLSMLATDIDPDSHRGIVKVAVKDDPEPLRLLRAAALYGSNASGKSTVLRAARALQRLILRAGRFRSDEGISGYEPFAGERHSLRPVRLGVKAVLNGIVYDYETSFDEKQVLTERLDQQQPDRAVNLFHRQKQEVTGEWTSDEQFQLIGREFRHNALLLSLADTLTPRLAGEIVPALHRLLQFFDGSGSHNPWNQRAARLASKDTAFRTWLLEQLKAADVGVTELAVKRVRRVVQEQGMLFEEISEEDQSAAIAETERYRFAFSHAGPQGAFVIPYEDESYGTRKVIDLAPVLYGLFSKQRPIAAFVDEIGASIHPALLNAMIRHVNCEKRDDLAHGQIIFATHETSLIDDEARKAILRRDQVYFTEKDSSGVARLYSLSDFKERQNINLRKRYLEGRYGAIPSLSPFPG